MLRRMLDDDHLTAEEQRVRTGLVTGDMVNLTRASGEVGEAGEQGTRGVVRASVLVELLTRESHGSTTLRMRNARITETVDLEGLEVVCPVYMFDCEFDGPLV